MGQSRVISFFISLCLHTAVFAAVLFWPASSLPPVDLNMPMLDLNLTTIGKPGGPPLQPVKPKTPDAPQTPPSVPQTQPDKPTPQPDPQKPEPVQAKPEVKPEPKPTPAPDAKPIADTPKKEDKPVNATKTAAPQKPKEKPEDVLRKALGDLGRSAPRQVPARGGGRPDPRALDRSLGDFKKSGAGDTSGDGPGGEGGDGIGVVGSYQQSLASRIKPHWEYVGRADRQNPTAVATISIAKDGTIIDAVIAQSSGNAAFDGSVLKAVKDTITVEPPPTPALMKVNITFAYEALAGGR